MTDDTSNDTTAGGNPDAAETVLLKGKPPVSDELIGRLRADLDKEISVKKKIRKERDDLKTQVETLTKERDAALAAAQELESAYEEFTSKDHQAKEIQRLQREILTRDVTDKIKSTEGVKLHDGVELSDLLLASGMQADFDKLQDAIPEDFTTKVIEAAKAKKSFLFATPDAVHDGVNESAVRKENPSLALPKFGGEVFGGGSAPAAKADPAKSVDWSDHRAVDRYFAARDGK